MRFGLYIGAVGPSPPKLSQPDLETPLSRDDSALPCANAVEQASFSRGLGHLVSWAGGHAMRPQAAMGAVLLLMLGSSLLFLRARPEKGGAPSRLSVIERGFPDRREDPGPASAPEALATADLRLVQEEKREPERAERAAVAKRASALTKTLPAEAPVDSADAGAMAISAASPTAKADSYSAAMALYERGRYEEAARELETIANSGTSQAPKAALFAAKSIEAGSGCKAAVSRYEAVASRFAKTSIRGDALLGAASCHQSLGHPQKARELYQTLRQVEGFQDRADTEIAKLDATSAD